jgi:signal transduction histidine kinase
MESERVRETRRRAAERRDRQMATIRPLAYALLIVFLVPALQGHPQPAPHGRGLLLAVALVGFTAAILRLLTVHTRLGVDQPPVRATLALLLVAAACLIGAALAQHGLPVELGMALVVFTAGARLPLRTGAAVALIIALAVDATMLIADQPPAYVVANTLLAVLLFLVARLVERARAEQQRAELLAAELADSVHVRERAARMEERGRIARDLHDVLAHSLSALSIQLQAARLLAQRGGDADLTAALDRAGALARTGSDNARQAVAALRGDAMPDITDLRQLVDDFSRDTGIATELAVHGEPGGLSADAGTAIYRTCQEALTNVARYSGAARAQVRFVLSADRAVLSVTDHHQPTAARTPLLTDAGSGYGLDAMRERIALLGGTVTAGPTADGWKVEVELPR